MTSLISEAWEGDKITFFEQIGYLFSELTQVGPTDLENDVEINTSFYRTEEMG